MRSISRRLPTSRVLVVTALTALIPVLSGAARAATSTWEIDKTHSSPTFRVRHFFTKVPGRFTDFAGTIQYDEQTPLNSKVEITIQSASIDTNEPKRDAHLRSADFLDAQNYPTITFRSTRVAQRQEPNQFTVFGDLTIRGVTRPESLQVEMLGSGPDAFGGQRMGLTAITTINRKDFGVNWNKVLDNGGTMLGDDVQIEVNVEAVRKPA